MKRAPSIRLRVVLAAGLATAATTVGTTNLVLDDLASADEGDYVQSFDDAASIDDLVFEIADGRSFPGTPKSFTGDHSLPDSSGMCGGPTSTRQLSSGDAPRAVPTRFDDAAVRSLGLAYWCANGTGHFMTAFDTSGYAHFDFRPDRTFRDVRRVCWDQNITDMGGKWTEVAVVPIREFNANDGRMDYTHPDRNGPNQPGSWGLPIENGVFKAGFLGGQQTSSFDQRTFRGSVDQQTTENKMMRTQHCVNDNGNGTVTITRGKADGGLQKDTLQGSFPSGEVVVIFSDVSYNPDKRDGHSADENTWHWDNLLVSKTSSVPAGGSSGSPAPGSGSGSSTPSLKVSDAATARGLSRAVRVG